MPVQVQLPGFNHAAPAVGLAQVIGAGFGAYKDYNQAQQAQAQAAQEAEQTKGLGIANEQSQMNLNQQKLTMQQMATPGTPATENARSGALVDLSSLTNTKFFGDPADANSPLNKAIASVSDPKQTGIGIAQIMDHMKSMTLPLTQGQQHIDANQPLAKVKADGVQVQRDKLNETKNQNSNAVGQAYDDDKIISKSKMSQNALKKALSILNNPNKPVTAGDLTLSYNDFIDAVANGGAGTEGKISREMPDTWVQKWNETKQKAGKNDDLRNTAAGAELISLLKENVYTVQADMTKQIADQAVSLHAGFSKNTNQQVIDTSKVKLKQYAPDAYAELYEGRAPKTSAQSDYPIGTKAKSKTGVPVIYKGNGEWAPQ